MKCLEIIRYIYFNNFSKCVNLSSQALTNVSLDSELVSTVIRLGPFDRDRKCFFLKVLVIGR